MKAQVVLGTLEAAPILKIAEKNVGHGMIVMVFNIVITSGRQSIVFSINISLVHTMESRKLKNGKFMKAQVVLGILEAAPIFKIAKQNVGPGMIVMVFNIVITAGRQSIVFNISIFLAHIMAGLT